MKRYAVIRSGAVFTVTETDDEQLAEREGWIVADRDVQVGDRWDGASFTRPAPQVDPTQLARVIEDQLDDDLDTLAREWGYKSSERLCTYGTSNNPTWRAEAQAFIAGRDSWWTKAAELQAAWQPGQPLPTYETVRAAMPVIARPA